MRKNFTQNGRMKIEIDKKSKLFNVEEKK